MKSFFSTYILFAGSVFVTLLIYSVCFILWLVWHEGWDEYTISDGSCNIAVLPVAGEIVGFSSAVQSEDGSELASTAADDALAFLREAEREAEIRGVLVRIDSYGGLPAASEIIANAVKKSPLPSVGLIREAGTSGGYLIATGADTIIASPFSDVGSIGVSMSYVENSEQNEKDGLRYVPLSSGEFKDYGNPNKPLTEAEYALLERDLAIYHEQFVQEVAENRNLPPEDIAALADGSSMPGSLALEHKLVDALGDQDTAREWFAERLGISSEEVVFCE